MIEVDRVYTLDQFAKAVGRSKRTIYRWIGAGLPASKMGGTYLISGIEVSEWMRMHEAIKEEEESPKV